MLLKSRAFNFRAPQPSAPELFLLLLGELAPPRRVLARRWKIVLLLLKPDQPAAKAGLFQPYRPITDLFLPVSPQILPVFELLNLCSEELQEASVRAP